MAETNEAKPLKVNIEVMIDTNANSRVMDDKFETVRDLMEFREYMQAAKAITGIDYEVTQRDTAQIFHEKTNCLTPELADEAGIEIKPDFVRENLEAGFYHVEPPVHGEDLYYEALANFLLKILPEKDPQVLKERGLKTAEDFTPRDLQDLYLEHMTALPKKFRQGKYAQDFKNYREVRFNAGEETAINFLRDHPEPAEGERTAFIFVGSDKWANEEMAKARNGKNNDDFGVFVGGPTKFRKMIEQVIREVEKDHPELKAFRAKFPKLGHIEGDPEYRAHSAGSEISSEIPPLEATPQPITAMVASEEARSFADFVLDSREQQTKQAGRGQ